MIIGARFFSGGGMGWRELARMGFSFLSFFFPFEKKAAVFFSCDGGESFPERENAPEETIYSQHTQRKQTNKRTNEKKENVAGTLSTGISVHSRRDFAKPSRGRSGKSRQSTGGDFVGKPSNDDDDERE